MKKSRQKSLPVIMHHLVSNDTSQLSVRPAVFEEQCRMLAEKGWFGISLAEAEDFLTRGEPLPDNSFLMTFDDGYLDNYIYAWPIMQKYGHKGVIFAVADLITAAGGSGEAANVPPSQTSTFAGGTVRPTVEDVWNGRCMPGELPSIDKLNHKGDFGQTVRRDLFFNWDEARLMEKSGVMAIAGHSTRHESVFAGPSFSGFLQPGDSKFTFVHTVPQSFWGMPAFTRVPELANRGFIPAPSMVEAIKKLVPQDEAGAREFFKDAANVRELEALVEGCKDKLGEFESTDAMKLRMYAVMERSQAVLSHELGHRIRSFCWPWGVFCDEAREQGLAAGFEVFYTTQLGINKAGSALSVSRFKVKDRADAWLPGRIRLYSRPLWGGLYLKMRL